MQEVYRILGASLAGMVIGFVAGQLWKAKSEGKKEEPEDISVEHENDAPEEPEQTGDKEQADEKKGDEEDE